MISLTIVMARGFSDLSEVGARGLLNLGKKHFDHQNWENLRRLKELDRHFKWIKKPYKKLAV